jgi:hypothetical protein
LLELPDEPGDIVVDGKKAWIACSAEDVVVEVNLVTNAIVHTYAIPSRHPLFLALEQHPAGERTILVTPQFSGNNSVPEKGDGARRAGSRVLDLDDPTVAVTGLPDEDAFRIDPVSNTVTPVLRSAGTILAGNGINPVTGDLWVLNTEARNKNPKTQTEPSIRGFIARNRASIAALPPLGAVAAPETPHTFVELDDTNPFAPDVQYDSSLRAVGQPWSIDFDSGGRAYVSGVASDIVVVHDASGGYVSQIDLPDGFQPRGVAVTSDGAGVVVWSGHLNEVRVYRTSSGHSLMKVHDVGYDPTPALVKKGRGVFYDGSHSLNGNATCGTCHVDGRFDLLTWNLSEGHADNKGPLFTQTLVGIDKLLPYHWRGERVDLIEFNAAFDGLLGGAPLSTGPGSDFEAFQAFVFSMQSSPNPHQHVSRDLDDSIPIPRYPSGITSASAVNGQMLFETKAVVGPLVCTECHTLPLGTNNDVFADDTSGKVSRRTHFKVTPFNGQWRKEMPLTQIELIEDGVIQPPMQVALLGAGLTHAGRNEDLLDFISVTTSDLQERADLTSFLHQLDQGIAPVVARVFLLNAFTESTVGPQLSGDLMPQAPANCDVIVYGYHDSGGTPTSMRWWWDASQGAAGAFVAEDSSVAPRSLQDFLDNAQVESHVFEPVAKGSGERHGVDFDGDGLYNLDELAEGTDPFDPDHDADGFPDGHEKANGGDAKAALAQPTDATPPVISNLAVLWNTTKVARLRFDTNEHTKYSITAVTNAPPPHDTTTIASQTFARTHSVLLRHLLPSTEGGPTFTYTVTVTATDPGGNAAVQSVQLTTLDFIPLTDVEAVIGEAKLTKLTLDKDGIEIRARFRVDEKLFGPPALPSVGARAILARVLVDGRVERSFAPVGGASFKLQDFTTGGAPGFDQELVPGPYLVSLATDANGYTRLAFRLDRPWYDITNEIRLDVQGVVRVSDAAAWLAALQACGGKVRCEPDLPTMDSTRSLTRWDMPDTRPENRGLTIGIDDLIQASTQLPLGQ